MSPTITDWRRQRKARAPAGGCLLRPRYAHAPRVTLVAGPKSRGKPSSWPARELARRLLYVLTDEHGDARHPPPVRGRTRRKEGRDGHEDQRQGDGGGGDDGGLDRRGGMRQAEREDTGAVAPEETAATAPVDDASATRRARASSRTRGSSGSTRRSRRLRFASRSRGVPRARGTSGRRATGGGTAASTCGWAAGGSFGGTGTSSSARAGSTAGAGGSTSPATGSAGSSLDLRGRGEGGQRDVRESGAVLAPGSAPPPLHGPAHRGPFRRRRRGGPSSGGGGEPSAHPPSMAVSLCARASVRRRAERPGCGSRAVGQGRSRGHRAHEDPLRHVATSPSSGRGLLLRRQDAVPPRCSRPARPAHLLFLRPRRFGKSLVREHARALLRPRPGRAVRRALRGPLGPRAPDAASSSAYLVLTARLLQRGHRRGRGRAAEDLLRGRAGQRAGVPAALPGAHPGVRRPLRGRARQLPRRRGADRPAARHRAATPAQALRAHRRVRQLRQPAALGGGARDVRGDRQADGLRAHASTRRSRRGRRRARWGGCSSRGSRRSCSTTCRAASTSPRTSRRAPRFNTLAGFTRADIERAVDEFLAAVPTSRAGPGSATGPALLDVLEQYYDGYRFAEDAPRSASSTRTWCSTSSASWTIAASTRPTCST